MKYTKQQQVAESTKTAALRLLNDIALVDVDLAAKIKPSIDTFVESLTDNDLLGQLTDFFKLTSTTDKAEWLKQHKEVTDAVKQIMDSTNVREEDDFAPGLDPDAMTKDEPKLDDTPSTNGGLADEIVNPDGDTSTASATADIVSNASPERLNVLHRMQLETKIREYIEQCLADLINNKVNVGEVASHVEGYDKSFASTGFTDELDNAFDKVLDALVKTLLDNYR